MIVPRIVVEVPDGVLAGIRWPVEGEGDQPVSGPVSALAADAQLEPLIPKGVCEELPQLRLPVAANTPRPDVITLGGPHSPVT